MSAHNQTRYRGRSRWLRLHADDRGIAMVSVGLLGAFLVMISVLVAVRTMQTSSSVDKDRSYEQAIHVAESGADQALYALDTGADLTEVTMAAAPTKGAVVDAALAVAASDPAEVVSTPEGDVVVIKDSTANTAYAVGFSPGIDSANRSARVIVVNYSFDPGTPITFPSGAVIAKGDVRVVGSGGTKTKTPGKGKAHIHTNKNFTGTGGGAIDGDVNASGTVTGGDIAGTATANVDPPVAFPTQEEVDEWQAALKASAMEGPTVAKLTGTITAPAYIAGDGSGSVTLNPSVDGPNVVYVEGSVKYSKGDIINNGVILVVANSFSMSGQATYSVTGDPANSGLVIFGTGDPAADITGQGEAAAQGFVYVPNGGVKLSGEAAFVGSIVAGGDVEFKGNGGMVFPEDLVPGPAVTPPVDGSPVVDGINEIGVGEL